MSQLEETVGMGYTHVVSQLLNFQCQRRPIDRAHEHLLLEEG
jgi:hypothetical protein